MCMPCTLGLLCNGRGVDCILLWQGSKAMLCLQSGKAGVWSSWRVALQHVDGQHAEKPSGVCS